jgi:hypothetical protein
VGAGTAVEFKFIATAPDGIQYEGIEIHNFTPIAGLTTPAIVHLDAGATYEFRFHLKDIFFIARQADTTFETLVKHGATLHVSLETAPGSEVDVPNAPFNQALTPV